MRVRASTIFGLLASACLHQPACLSYEFASRCFCWIVKKTILIDYLVHIIFINTTLILSRYSHAIISFPCSFLAVNHHNSKNWVPFILTHNLWLIFMGIKKKQKLSFSTLQRAELFLPKFYRLVLGIVGLIDAKGINMTPPIPMKISHKLCVRMDGTQFLIFWWFTAKNEHGNDIIAWVYQTII